MVEQASEYTTWGSRGAPNFLFTYFSFQHAAQVFTTTTASTTQIKVGATFVTPQWDFSGVAVQPNVEILPTYYLILTTY